MQLFISLSDDSKEEKIEQKQDYTEVCHQLVDSVSNLHDCQSHTKVHSTLISQEKLAQPSLSQTIIVSEYSKVLGVEEPHLQTVLTKVAGVQARVQTELMMTPQLQQGNKQTVYKHTIACVCMHGVTSGAYMQLSVCMLATFFNACFL